MYNTAMSVSHRLVAWDQLTIVASQEAVPIPRRQSSARVLLGVLQGDVHVTIEAGEES
jgi:hypothetical protein